MKIRFLGLIVHARLFDDGTQVAVLMQHDTHNPILTISEASLNVDKTTAEPYAHENGVYCFRLSGHVDAPRRGASKTAGIDDLPRVTKMSTPEDLGAHPGILRRENHPDLFHATFEIPRGGELTSEDHFRNEGAHKFNIHCVGRTVLYTLSTNDDVEFTLRHDGGKKIVVKNYAEYVYVTNRCAVENVSGISDQVAYAKFFSQVPDSITPVAPTATLCATGSAETAFTTCTGAFSLKPENIDVDCTSSRYP